METLRQFSNASELDYSKLWLGDAKVFVVPVICIDSARLATDGLMAYRMQGFADEQAVDMSLKTGIVTLYSRTRKGLWVKGETSGNFLLIRDAYTDCDADSVLYDVDAIGTTCHTGAVSCFTVKTIGE